MTQPAAVDVPRLEMRGVRKRFGATLALDGVDLAVHAGSIHALVGENGAGKSTLMKILAGADTPDAGSLWLDGQPFRPRRPCDARRAGVAMIYQELSLAPHLSVEENLVLGVEPATAGLLRRGEMRRRARAALAELDHGDLDPAVPVHTLPPAVRQVVEIARALVTGCRVLVLDEPTSSLTQPDVQRLFALLRRLRGQGLAIVYISHFLEEVKELSSHITVLRDGRVTGGGPTPSLTTDEIVRLMVGRHLAEMYPHSPRQQGEPILEVAGLSGRAKPAAAGFTLHRGEVFGIAGLVGAGRTELLRALFGLDPVRAGTIRIGSHSGPGTPASRLRQGCGFLSEDRKSEGLALGLSVADNLTLSKLRGLGPFSLVLPARQHAAAQKWVERLGIRCRHPRQECGALSGGNQQKVALGRLLYHDVDVLLLDEPTRGVDVASRAHIYELIDRLVAAPVAGRPPKAVLMVSSYLPELLGVCDRIAVMCQGRLGPARPVAAWDEPSLMRAATGMGE